MIEIATNIFNTLSPEHRNAIEGDIKKLFNIGGDFKLKEYKEKTNEETNHAKFFFGDLPLKKMSNDPKTWESFKDALSKIYRYSKEDGGNLYDVQFWITSPLEDSLINVSFSTKTDDEISDKWNSLRETILVSKTFDSENIQPKKLLILGYDNDEATWRISHL